MRVLLNFFPKVPKLNHNLNKIVWVSNSEVYKTKTNWGKFSTFLSFADLIKELLFVSLPITTQFWLFWKQINKKHSSFHCNYFIRWGSSSFKEIFSYYVLILTILKKNQAFKEKRIYSDGVQLSLTAHYWNWTFKMRYSMVLNSHRVQKY